MNLVKVNVSEDTRNRLREINQRTGKYLYTILSEAIEEYYARHILKETNHEQRRQDND